MINMLWVCLLFTGALEGDLKSALSELRGGKVREALATLEEIGANSADYAKAQYLRGETLLALGDATAAEEAFRNVVRDRPGSVPALVGLGRALLQLGLLEEAQEHLRAALEEDEEDAGARRAMAQWWLGKGEIESARELVEAVYREQAKDPENVRAMVELELRAGQPDTALGIAIKFSRQNKKHPLGPFLEGLALEQSGKEVEAIAAYQKSLQRDDHFLDAHKNLGILGHTLSNTYAIVERNALAMEHYARYFELGGRDPVLEKTFRQLEQLVQQGIIAIR